MRANEVSNKMFSYFFSLFGFNPGTGEYRDEISLSRLKSVL
jgi:hypothetical protein